MEDITINVALNEKSYKYRFNSENNAEELCTKICQQLNISPIARSLFSLQIHGTKIFVSNNSPLEKNNNFDLRLRFKVPCISRLKQLDKHTYNYYFHQVRKDVLENNVPEIIYSKHREELLGLGIADMYRVMIEEGKNSQDVMKDYKKYIPREVTKKHSIFTKKPIFNTLTQLQKNENTPSFSFVIEKYLSQFDALAPNYLAEDYKVTLDRNGSLYDGTLHVMPFHKEQPGLRILYDKENEWEHLCNIDELCFMTIRKDGTIEISRLNGIPLYFKFVTVGHMNSFVSACDGYYRHMVKWTFNICKDVFSPSLKRLQNMKCHGPIGGEFSYHKLEEKRSNRPGSFIIRQCEREYDVYYIDVCSKSCSKPVTYKIECKHHVFVFDGKYQYKSISEIVAAYKNPDDELYLQECLPPSEYDKSQLLLCKLSMLGIASRIDDDDLETILATNKGPRCIDSKDLQLYKGTRIEGSEKASYFYKVRWNVAQGKKMDVAMKMLKQDVSEIFFKEFIEQAGQWAFLKTTAVVKLYGITLRSPVSMILEYMPYGSLDHYLRTNTKNIQMVDLVEASATLATALWHLSENGIVHGRIRCGKLLVAWHDSSRFTVKLSDIGLHSSYKDPEIHWIPLEYFNNMDLVRKSTSGDVWAFATTLWEIFSYGASPDNINQPLTKKNYMSGSRLNGPKDCPKEIYLIMRGCWHADPHNRMRPQVIMRDVNHLLYQVFNSRRVHSYSTIMSRFYDTSIAGHNAVERFLSAGEAEEDISLYDSRQTSTTDDGGIDDDTLSNESNHCDFDFEQRSTDGCEGYIYEFEGYNVILQGLIGQGNYGYVFKGALQKEGTCESQVVAVKKLISNTESSQLDDFDHEIHLAKTLKHRNIVEILGVVDNPEILLIMEFIQHGSLKSYLNIHKTTIKKNQLLNYALDVACGMEYLETRKVVHRDLAARNILVVDENHVKISDFGLAREMDNGGYYVFKSNRALPLNWYAPESKTGGKFSTKSDVWSYGITLWEMFSFGMEPPPWDPENCNERMPNKLQCPVFCPVEVYRDLIVSCWEFIPTERPTFTQLYNSCQRLRSENMFD